MRNANKPKDNLHNKNSNNNKKEKLCAACKRSLTPIKKTKIDTPDTRKMLRIMKKNKLTQSSLARELDITPGTIHSWFNEGKYTTGKINKKYFVILKEKGIA